MSISHINANKPENSRLTLIEITEEPFYSKKRKGIVKCECGNTKEIHINSLINGYPLSCGCLYWETRAKRKWQPYIKELRSSYSAMKRRCYDKNFIGYSNYGGRGVTVCDEWRNDYQKFLDWSLANGWDNGLELDKDKKGDGMFYSPETCCWLTKRENLMYKRVGASKLYDYKGQELTISDICKIEGLNHKTFAERLRHCKTGIMDAIYGEKNKKIYRYKKNTIN